MFDKTRLAGIAGAHMEHFGTKESMASFLTVGQLPVEDNSAETERYGMARRTEHEVDGAKVAVTTYVQTTVQPVIEGVATSGAPGPELSGE